MGPWAYWGKGCSIGITLLTVFKQQNPLSGDIILCAMVKLPAGWHCLLDPQILLCEMAKAFNNFSTKALKPVAQCPQMAGFGWQG